MHIIMILRLSLALAFWTSTTTIRQSMCNNWIQSSVPLYLIFLWVFDPLVWERSERIRFTVVILYSCSEMSDLNISFFFGTTHRTNYVKGAYLNHVTQWLSNFNWYWFKSSDQMVCQRFFFIFQERKIEP